MVQIIVEKNKIMLIDLIYEKYPYLPYSVICKTLRNKDVKVCGKRVNSNIEVLKGDIVQLYVDVDAYVKKSYAVLYENDYVLIVSKDQGVIVNNDSNSLIDLINKEYNGNYELCHRLDRNTGGILIISKNKDKTSTVCDIINSRDYKKIYTAVVAGDMRQYQQSTILKAWHFKDAKKNTVFIYNEERKHTKEIFTAVRCIDYDSKNNISTVEIDLITGRTHQIRAHMAHLGHPVIGDGKYGNYDLNRKFAAKYQLLWASALIPHNIKNSSGLLPDEPLIDKPRFKFTRL